MEIKEILERIALPARSGKKGFKVTDKLEAVCQLLKEEGSPYRLLRKSPQAWIFGKTELRASKTGENPLVISTHADIVSEITKPSSEYLEEEQYFKGTYDNLGTNAACVNLMINEELPDNVYFAFTADEETGRCNGARYVLSYMRDVVGVEPTMFALDVTEEGYDSDRLFTVEGLHAVSEEKRRGMLELFMDTEGDEQSFEVVRLKKKDDNSFLPESYQAEDTTEYDESVFYAKHGCNSCSICLPGDGSMHSNSGFYIKEAVMKGYSLSLAAGILAFTTRDQDRIQEIKAEKDALVKEAKETPFYRIRVSYPVSSHSSNYSSDYSHRSSDYSGGYYGGGLGSYWMRKMRGIQEEQVPGQMSLSDIDDEFTDDEENYNPCDVYSFEQMTDDFYESATCYTPDQFDMFYTDMVYTYGLKMEDDLEEYLKGIFDEVQEEYGMDYYYE